MRRYRYSFDQMAALALSGVAQLTGRTVEDLAPCSFEIGEEADGSPYFVVSVRTDRDPVPAEAFEPS